MRFTCQPGCTKCCEKQGFVYLTEDDLTRLAGHLEMTSADFEKRYVFRTRHLLRLRVPRYAQCEFLSEGGCSVHEVKPLQCRTFPYWPDLVRSRRKWHSTGDWCPGIGSGELINIETAQAIAAEMKQAHPRLYEE